MVKLTKGIVDVMLYEYDPQEFLRRISDPYWFQALACVLGFDWHSSGTTTTTCGALKMAIKPEEHGLMVAGGKGKASRNTPSDIEKAGDIFHFQVQPLMRWFMQARSRQRSTTHASRTGTSYTITHLF